MKVKTGSKNTKIGTPRIAKVVKPITEKKEKTPDNTRIVAKQETDTITEWIKKSSETKPKQSEGGESKLQWRKETKKSQRSFSKNKERNYSETKSKQEYAPSDARGEFRNTFDKSAIYEGQTRQSSWDPKSKKPSIGFEKSKTGYKGVGTTWDKSTTPRVSTRTWDDARELSSKTPDTKKKSSRKITPEKNIKTPYIPPVVTWGKETKIINKKELIDPTK